MPDVPILETERLVLRDFAADDGPALFRIMSDRETNVFLPMFPLERPEEAAALLCAGSAWRGAAARCWAVCPKSAGTPVGYVRVAADANHDLGYALRREFWGRGFMTEACRAVLGALRREGTPYVTATHDVNNPASGAVMKKIGMTYCYSYRERRQPKDIRVIFRMWQVNLDGRDERIFRKYWDNASVRFVEQDV